MLYRADWRSSWRSADTRTRTLDRLVHGRLDLEHLEPLEVGGAREGRDDLDSLDRPVLGRY